MKADQTIAIASSGIKAEIARHGAELVRLQDEEGRDLLWNGDPAFWTGHAPVLFPIIGRLKDDHLTVGGKTYPMPRHGFARTSLFEIIEQAPTICRMRLQANAETRGSYPFDFSLELTYRVGGRDLDITAVVRNRGSAPMPVAMGFHPAFRWPLPYGATRPEHSITFERDEPEPVRQVVEGLLSPVPKRSPVAGRQLALTDDLFREDALIFLDPRSRSVRYGPRNGRSLRVDFPDMPQLGIWTKPGAGFICIEPWHGYASPEDFDGEMSEKPGIVSLPPDKEETFGIRICLDPP